MNLKKILFDDLIDFKRHNSSYFNIDASIVVMIVFLIPEILSRFNFFFVNFGALVLFVIAFFEKKSKLVKFCCIEYGLIDLAFKLLLNMAGFIASLVPFFETLFAVMTIAILIFTSLIYFYMLYRAYQYKGWKIPFIGDFVLRIIMKVNL
ncbi:MAG: hypothetical protein ACI4WM_01505 [Erysipelotrichaceae bacterium]